MKIQKMMSSLLALGLSLTMGVGQTAQIFAETNSRPKGIEVKVPQPSGERKSTGGKQLKKQDAVYEAYKDSDVVRVSIVLEGKATTNRYSTKNIAKNTQAMKYRDVLQKEQKSVTAQIEKNVLGGKKLDVVWNMTLAANMISANVEYGKIDAIKAQKGVKTVVIERKYDPAVVEKNEDDPNMATSSQMIGSYGAYSAGYLGAGSVIAVIDTGIDTDHQSFDAGAYDYAMEEEAMAYGLDAETFKAAVGVLTKEDVIAAAKELNVFQYRDTYDIDDNEVSWKYKGKAEDLYVSTKIPFAFNYADNDLDITHDNDAQGEHGSHVEGIAAANMYIPDGEGGYDVALSNVHTMGVAPDAQILSMKVFGKKGGAYDSDYMVAIEDAIVLGADAVNLSLGSANPGFTSETDYVYSSVLADLEKTDTVVSISMGNAYSLAQYSYLGTAAGLTYNYADDVSYSTGGSPGSYTNALTVASIDNWGKTDRYIDVNGWTIFFNESLTGQDAEGNEVEYGNSPLISLAGEHEYVYIDGIGADAEEDEEGYIYDENGKLIFTLNQFKEIGVEGKIAICNRGTSSFFVKANAAIEAGAAAVIIANNAAGDIFMNLTGYEYDAPAVTISIQDANYLKNAYAQYGDEYIPSEEHETESGIKYYTGSLVIGDDVRVEMMTYTPAMSDFSSWGVPESLELKPEITAPGGNIYSVNGLEEGGKGYENMSGTSMAAPQIAGMSALVAQHIKFNGLDEMTGMSVRQLAQSLLMGTAEPQMEYDGNSVVGYYSVLKQGAGLANVGNAVMAKSYITMDPSATRSAKDGKVKVELGDDPDRTGKYTYTFTINNMSDVERVYELYTDFFTQDQFNYNWDFLDTWTVLVDNETTYAGDAVQDDTVTVPAGGKATVTVTAQLDTEALDEYAKGAYVEGYTYITPVYEDEEGAEDDVEQSIPVLGFYGNWSDPSMFDKEDMVTDQYAINEYYPYSYDSFEQFAAQTGADPIYYANVPIINENYNIINPLDLDEEAYYERRALNSQDTFGYTFRLIRNAAAVAMYAKDAEGGIMWVSDPIIDVDRPFYYAKYGVWLELGEEGMYYFGANDFDLAKTAAGLGLSEGDTFKLGVVAIPEYYSIDSALTSVQIKKMMNDGTLGEGAYLESEFTVDDTEPEIISAEIEGDEDSGYKLVITAKDNEYIAGAAFIDYATVDEEGNTFLAYTVGGEQEKNGEVTLELDVTGPEVIDGMEAYVFDYAANMAPVFDTKVMEKLNINPEETEAVVGTEVAYTVTNELGKPYDSATLNWELEGYTAAGTYIDQGVVYIDENETSDVLTVTASLTEDNNAYPELPKDDTNAEDDEPVDAEEGEEEEDNTLYATATIKVLQKFNVIVITTEGGKVDPVEAEVVEGETVTINITPDERYTATCKVNGRDVDVSSGKLELTVTENMNVEVVFHEPEVYTVSVTAGDNGKVDPITATAFEGDTVTLTITPDENYMAIVKVDGEEADASSGKLELTVTKNIEVEVTFKEIIGATAMYRLYNPNSGEHFFTAKEKEKDALVTYGWTYEGIGWFAPEKSETPVYRLYNSTGGEHHYTTNEKERDALKGFGWTDEGTGWFSDDEKTVPLYRVYNPNEFANNHHYTKNIAERDALITYGWRDEGIGWYGVEAGE